MSDEPDTDCILGERPVLPASFAGVARNLRSGVGALLSAANRVDAPRQAVEEIRELHTQGEWVQFFETGWHACAGCGQRWPCSTAAILERHNL